MPIGLTDDDQNLFGANVLVGYMKAWEGQFSTNEVEQQKVEAKYAWIKETLKKF